MKNCKIYFKKYKRWAELQKKGKEYAVDYHMNLSIKAKTEKEAKEKMVKVIERMFGQLEKVGSMQFYNSTKDELIKDFEFIWEK